MRGYGGSFVPTTVAAYALREIVADMVELHDFLGRKPAVWIGHDWGAPVAWSLAAHHPDRCRAVSGLCIPYFARGMTLDVLASLVDRDLYPAADYPVGQWDYWLYHREQFEQSARDLEADVPGTIATLYRTALRDGIGKPARVANMRANGGWFGEAHVAPATCCDERMVSQAAFDELVQAFTANGFRGANAWYLNDEANRAYAAEAANFGRLFMPALFVHAAWDVVCDTLGSRLAEPMRVDCANLTETTIEAGHELSLEEPEKLNDAIQSWLTEQGLRTRA
jgi:pimeloyl-ACP methyl ester carboxylesterase